MNTLLERNENSFPHKDLTALAVIAKTRKAPKCLSPVLRDGAAACPRDGTVLSNEREQLLIRGVT